MTKFFALLTFLLAFSSATFAGEREHLISLQENFDGHGMRTRELMLKHDGTVVIELRDYDKAPKDGGHIVTVVRKINRRDIGFIVEQAASLVRALPEYIDSERPITLDPENKVIRIKSKGVELFSGWAAYQDAPASPESKSFQEVWQSLEALLAPPGT